jgi:hypothetical protein
MPTVPCPKNLVNDATVRILTRGWKEERMKWRFDGRKGKWEKERYTKGCQEVGKESSKDEKTQGSIK